MQQVETHPQPCSCFSERQQGWNCWPGGIPPAAHPHSIGPKKGGKSMRLLSQTAVNPGLVRWKGFPSLPRIETVFKKVKKHILLILFPETAITKET